MPDSVYQEPEHICQYCENSLSGKNPGYRLCYHVSGFRIVLFGPRVVPCNHTCGNFALQKAYRNKNLTTICKNCAYVENINSDIYGLCGHEDNFSLLELIFNDKPFVDLDDTCGKFKYADLLSQCRTR